MDRLEAIDTFVRISKAGCLAKAAERPGLSRALVTRHLQQIEGRLGVRLFNRTTRREGERSWRHAGGGSGIPIRMFWGVAEARPP